MTGKGKGIGKGDDKSRFPTGMTKRKLIVVRATTRTNYMSIQPRVFFSAKHKNASPFASFRGRKTILG